MRATLVLSLLLASSSAFAQPAPSDAAAPAANGDFLRRTEQIIRRATEAASSPDSMTDQQKIDAAARIARDAQKGQSSPITIQRTPPRLPALNGVAAAEPPPNLLQGARQTPSAERGIYIFVSDSLSDDELKAAMEAANATGASVVFRGVKRGLSIPKSFARAYRIARTVDPIPSVNIDPTPFSRFGVGSVPSVVIHEGDRYVKVAGSLSVDYARRRFDSGEFGDAGARGPTSEIVEVDLIDEMKERVGRIDWEAKKQGAISRYWNNVRFHPLPVAQRSAVRYFDPTVVNQDEIRDQEGRVVAPAGVAINPLDLVAFNKTIVAFDATNKQQLALAKRISEQEIASGRGAILLTTAIDRSRPWESIAEYNRFLFPNRPYLLDDLVAGRFGITSVPSVIRAEGRQFRIEEIVLKEGADQ